MSPFTSLDGIEIAQGMRVEIEVDPSDPQVGMHAGKHGAVLGLHVGRPRLPYIEVVLDELPEQVFFFYPYEIMKEEV